MPTVSFSPSGSRAVIESGTPLIEACRQAGFSLPSPCGGKGLCGKCRVKMLAGDIPIDRRQRGCLPDHLLQTGWRAACVVREYGDLTLADPVADTADSVILTDFLSRETRGSSGLWEYAPEMPPPSATDRRDDETRLCEALAEGGALIPETVRMDFSTLVGLPEALRSCGFKCRVVGMGERILAIESAEAAGRRLGLAVDVGTTTVAAALCDLGDGSVLAVASRANPQSRYGDDVVSRIEHATRGQTELAEMRGLAVDTLEDLAEETRRHAGMNARPLLMVVAANTVMNHLLLGVSPAALAVSPFVPAFKGPVVVNARHLGWRGASPPLVHVITNISSYAGGDITAGLLAHDIQRLGGTTLFLDVGTNGEIVLADSGKLYACATAAGPAFEGARIKQGMRAAPGAVSRVCLSGRGMLEIGTVENMRPARGICGTGLLDAIALLATTGLIDEGGRLLCDEEARQRKARAAPALLSLLHEDDDGRAFWLERPGGRDETGVKLTQGDIREFQLAKGALAAGVRVLLETAGIPASGIDRVMLAGGFGNYLDPVSAVAVGLLPAGISADRVRSVGNAALAGARLCLLSRDERNVSEEIARKVEYVELSGRGGFQTAFAEEMLFPTQY